MATYYVARTGKDTNSGIIESPWKTVNYGLAHIYAGDTLYIRAGTYAEKCYESRDGTASAHITVRNYPNETPIIDGGYITPADDWGSLFRIAGDYVDVIGLEVKRSNWMGVNLDGAHCTVTGCIVHHNMEHGIILKGDYTIADGCTLYQNCYSNVHNTLSRGDWGAAISACRSPTGAVIRNCTSYMNWGEGMSTYQCDGTLVEDNVIYDNFTGLYVHDAPNVVVQRNLIAQTGAMTYGSRVGILSGKEYTDPVNNSHWRIINNLCAGNVYNFYRWEDRSIAGSHMDDVLIAGNTFINATAAGIRINAPYGAEAHVNVWLRDNIVVQTNGKPHTELLTVAGISRDHNCWNSMPPANAQGAGDVIADPMLLLTAPVTGRTYYQIPWSSPAKGAGIADAGLLTDYDKVTRFDPPTMGAFEAPEDPLRIAVRGYIATAQAALDELAAEL